jgi:HAD superfamily hydrolase (TIGR01509 family)
VAANKNLSNEKVGTGIKQLERMVENRKLNVKAIIFDLDGTIVDSKEAYLEAARVAFSTLAHKEIGVRTAMEIPKRFELSLPLNDLIKGIDEKNFREVYLRAYYEATRTRTKPFPDVGVVLQNLSKRMKLALTTRRHVSKSEVICQLEKFRLANYFQAVVTAIDAANPKPSPEALIQCSEKLRVALRDCAVVGDSVTDVKAGKNAGAKTVAVLSGIFSLKELQRENPDLILEDVKKLPDFLE